MTARLIGVIVALAAAVSVLGCASSSDARSVPRGFLGVVADGPAVDGTVPFDREAARMARSGVETVGLSFDWMKAQPARTMDEIAPDQRAAYRLVDGVPTTWAPTDRLVGAAARHHIRVFPVVIQAPVWARSYPDRTFSPPADPAAYASFIGALVRRYGPGGDFWKANPRLHAVPIHDWQVWNEPAGADSDDRQSVFWQDGNRPFTEHYLPLLAAARKAIKDADPHARVVLAALVGRSWRTLAKVYAAGARRLFDVVALHPYTANVVDVPRIVRYTRTAMAHRGDRRKPIVITEIGWPAFSVKDVRKAGRRKADKIQAGWAPAVIKALASQRRKLGIERVLWYRWMSHDTSRTNAFDYAGLIRVGPGGKVTPKPALKAFSKAARHLEGRR